jgi:DNA phosphorothioation-dependent restriction protein DptG
MSGELEGFWVYSYSDQVYLRLKNQPTSHAGCDPSYFVIPPTVSADRRKAMLARLSLAYAMRETVNIGYAASGDCAQGHIQVYRVG